MSFKQPSATELSHDFLWRTTAKLPERARIGSVDDTLAHRVEAYSGMPQLFFTWVQRPDKRGTSNF